MPHKVKCYFCGHIFDRDKESFMAIPDKARRYAHERCFLKAYTAQQADEENKAKLEAYIKELFNYKSLPEAVNKQIRQYVTENNYTYSGILKALKYHYEVKHGSKEKAYGRIGIVPYVYDESHNYYLALWEAKQKNEVLVATQMNQCEAPVIEVHIPIPQRKPMKKLKQLFTFLEDALEETNE